MMLNFFLIKKTIAWLIHVDCKNSTSCYQVECIPYLCWGQVEERKVPEGMKVLCIIHLCFTQINLYHLKLNKLFEEKPTRFPSLIGWKNKKKIRSHRSLGMKNRKLTMSIWQLNCLNQTCNWDTTKY